MPLAPYFDALCAEAVRRGWCVGVQAGRPAGQLRPALRIVMRRASTPRGSVQVSDGYCRPEDVNSSAYRLLARMGWGCP